LGGEAVLFQEEGEGAAVRFGGVFGGVFGVLGSGELGDGGDGAEVGVEDEFFDEGIGSVGAGGDGFTAVATGVAGGGARFAREVAAGD
jgi:hypothetical protein